MKAKLFLLLAIMIYGNTFSQWEEHLISEDLLDAGSIFAADFNGDGDMDVISGSTISIDWWENDGSNVNFERHPISTDVDRPYQVYAFDIDYDDDMDVFYTSRDDNKLAWHENTDGLGNFGPQQLITAQANTNGARFLDIANIDGDELEDVISASAFDYKIAWYKNLGNGNFGDQNIISGEVEYAISVHAAYINEDDEFMDVVAVSYHAEGTDQNGKITWFKNDGEGNFDNGIIVETGMAGVASVTSGDFDGDGDIDLISATQFTHILTLHINDGEGNFVSQIISNEAWGVVFVYATDIECDGDPDFLAALINVDKILLFANDGSGNFEEILITSNVDFPVSVHAEDMDDFGSIDVLSASVLDHKIAWYENEEACILSVNENTLIDFSIYPNPVSELLTISIAENVLFEKAVVYSLLGEKLLETSEKNIHVSSLATGLYFIQLSVDGKTVTKQFIKE